MTFPMNGMMRHSETGQQVDTMLLCLLDFQAVSQTCGSGPLTDPSVGDGTCVIDIEIRDPQAFETSTGHNVRMAAREILKTCVLEQGIGGTIGDVGKRHPTNSHKSKFGLMEEI